MPPLAERRSHRSLRRPGTRRRPGRSGEADGAYVTDRWQIELDYESLRYAAKVGARVDFAVERRALVTARRAETHGDHGCRRLERTAEAAPHSIAKPGISTVGDGVPTRPMKNVAPGRRFQTRSNSRS